jgi:hypothetical protein
VARQYITVEPNRPRWVFDEAAKMEDMKCLLCLDNFVRVLPQYYNDDGIRHAFNDCELAFHPYNSFIFLSNGYAFPYRTNNALIKKIDCDFSFLATRDTQPYDTMILWLAFPNNFRKI